jgi:hypothetical protein
MAKRKKEMYEPKSVLGTLSNVNSKDHRFEESSWGREILHWHLTGG